MKYMVLAGVLVMAVTLLVRAEPPAAKESASAADAAWTKIKAGVDAVNAGDQDEATARKEITALLGETHDFMAKYASDPRATDATMLWTQLAGSMISHDWPGAPKQAELNQVYDRLAADKDLPAAERGEIRVAQLVRAMATVAQETGDTSADWVAVEDGIGAFQKEFGDDFTLDGGMPAMGLLREKEIEMLSSSSNSPGAHKILEKLSHDPNPDVAQLATMGLDRVGLMAGLKTKPVELKFTAADGREVDVAKLRGKVVLLDFWATWCGPCVARVPEVVDTYKKYHDKGLEIVGVSLDEDKDTMQSFAQRKEMTWPQYFDGQRFDNKVSKGFDIDSIPSMWLLDKKGMLVTTDAADDLPGQVERLLKSP